MPDEQWYAVQSEVKILATDEDAAVDKLAELTRKGIEQVKGGDVFPVGTYRAAPCADPTRRHRTED